MNEYKIRELAEYVAAYYSQEPDPDYTVDGLEKALEWAWGDSGGETVAGWSVEDVLERARDEFDLQLTLPQARKILVRVGNMEVDWSNMDYCIQQWEDGKR